MTTFENLHPLLQTFIKSWVQTAVVPNASLEFVGEDHCSTLYVVREIVSYLPSKSIELNSEFFDWNAFSVRVAHITFYTETESTRGLGSRKELLSESDPYFKGVRFRDLCSLADIPSLRPINERPFFTLENGCIVRPFLLRTTIHRTNELTKVDDLPLEETLLSDNYYIRLRGRERAKLAKQNEQVSL